MYLCYTALSPHPKCIIVLPWRTLLYLEETYWILTIAKTFLFYFLVLNMYCRWFHRWWPQWRKSQWVSKLLFPFFFKFHFCSTTLLSKLCMGNKKKKFWETLMKSVWLLLSTGVSTFCVSAFTQRLVIYLSGCPRLVELLDSSLHSQY